MADVLLSQEECRALEDDRILLPRRQPGKRIFSGSFLWNSSGSSSSTGSVSSTSSTASVRYHRNKIQRDIETPESLDSAAALEFIGITPDTALEIHSRWELRPDPAQNPYDLMDYVYGHTAQIRKDSWESYSDGEVMTRLRVQKWLQNAILR